MKFKTLPLVVVLLVFAGSLNAQVPNLTVKVQWTPNPPADAVTQYTLVVDSGAPLVVLPAACGVTVCEQVITVAFAKHTLSLTASNQWGVSPPATLAVDLGIPVPPVNLRITR